LFETVIVLSTFSRKKMKAFSEDELFVRHSIFVMLNAQTHVFVMLFEKRKRKKGNQLIRF